MIGPGKDSTEHARAIRAEILGAVIAILGAGFAVGATYLSSILGACVGCFHAAFGLILFGWTATSYAKARSSIKAAAATPPPPATIHHHAATGARRI